MILKTNRILHRSPIQTEKSSPEGKWIMPETRFTEFPELSVDPRVRISRSELVKTELPALSVDPRVGISRSAFKTDV